MESAEHVWIGDHISLQFPDHTPSPGKHPAYSVVLDEIGSVQLTYGRIIALAGDFFGVLGGQICRADDHEAAFRKAWETLARADAGELANIVSIMEEEIRALDAVLRTRKREPHEMYDELGDELSQRWNGVTGGSSDYWVPAGRYLKLAAENFDHFGHGAETAYRAGHVVAMKEAAAAAKLSGSAAYAGLVRAYAMNAFADHFLTDLFSAGHLRVPRQELFDVTNTYWDAGHVTGVGAYISGLLVKGMHDEDSKYGLTVKNALGDHWTAYGDKYLLDLKEQEELRTRDEGRAGIRRRRVERVPGPFPLLRSPESQSEPVDPGRYSQEGRRQVRQQLAGLQDAGRIALRTLTPRRPSAVRMGQHL